jgi:hypothetical protein
VSQHFEASVVWLSASPLRAHQPYLLKHTTRTVQARVQEIRHVVDVNSLAHRSARELRLNDIGVVSVEAQQPVYCDPYRRNRVTGAFILVDPLNNRTVAAGMIRAVEGRKRVEGPVTAGERQARYGHPGLVIVLRKCEPEVVWMLERRLFDHGCAVYLATDAAIAATAASAGLIAVVGGEAELPGAIEFDGSLLPENSEAAVEVMYQAVEPRLHLWASPLTDGDGI